jgi:hypothetical protein
VVPSWWEIKKEECGDIEGLGLAPAAADFITVKGGRRSSASIDGR